MIDDNGQLSIRIKQNDENILNIAVKYFILSFIAIILCQLFMIISAIQKYSFKYFNFDYLFYEISETFIIIMLSIDCCINCICIFLNFGFKHKWYLFICNKCHKQCKVICLKYVTRKLTKIRNY